LVGVLLGAACTIAPLTSDQRERLADERVSGITLTPSVGAVSLVAAGAIADFGVGSPDGVRLVRVRIVDTLELSLRLETAHDMALAEPPSLCLIGPYSAPDDAGLSDPCWGEPDLTALLAQELTANPAGKPLLAADRPVDIAITLERGDERCDYPTGDWLIELKLNPLIEGAPAGSRYGPDVPISVPLSATEPLLWLPTTQTRYCGLATLVYQQQGEPQVIP
jgi:hypothetical protein